MLGDGGLGLRVLLREMCAEREGVAVMVSAFCYRYFLFSDLVDVDDQVEDEDSL